MSFEYSEQTARMRMPSLHWAQMQSCRQRCVPAQYQIIPNWRFDPKEQESIIHIMMNYVWTFHGHHPTARPCVLSHNITYTYTMAFILTGQPVCSSQSMVAKKNCLLALYIVLSPRSATMAVFCFLLEHFIVFLEVAWCAGKKRGILQSCLPRF